MEMNSVDGPVQILHVAPDGQPETPVVSALRQREQPVEIHRVTTVEDALSTLESRTIDCLVSNDRLTDGNPIELVESVVQGETEIPVVVLTERDRIDEVLSAGVTDLGLRENGNEQLVANRIITRAVAHRRCRIVDREQTVNTLLRGLNRRLVQTTSTEGVQQAVCETLTESAPYRFAWMGEPDAESDAIDILAAAGDAEAYLDEVDIHYHGEKRAQGPAGMAIETGEPQVVGDIRTNPAFEPWRDAAERYGFRSVIALPIAGAEADYGVLAIYADTTDAFGETEQAVLSELSDTVGRALDRVQTRKQLREREVELARTNAVLETLFDELPVGVLVEDADRKVMTANQRLTEIFGFDREPADLEGADCEQFARDIAGIFEDPEGFVEDIRTQVERREPSYAKELELAEGRTLERSYHPIVLPDEAGHLWVYRDVTEQKERERRLQRQNERLDTFTSVVSHDLRNPLNVAVGYLELAREESDSEHLERVEEAHDRIRRLIEDLLTVARQGTRIESVEWVQLSETTQACWRNVDTGQATLETVGDIRLCADPGPLKQLLENLIRNAVDHAGDGVTITIGPVEDGFYVEDDGPGIPPEDREQVFETGYSTSESGTGFGLAIARQVAESHGWTVTLEAGADGGARFVFTGVETDAQ